jgi:hypothetical protein
VHTCGWALERICRSGGSDLTVEVGDFTVVELVRPLPNNIAAAHGLRDAVIAH